MIKFLVYVVLILATITVSYLIRLFELSVSLQGKKTEEVTEKDNKFMSRVMLLALIAFFAFTFYNLKSFGSRLLPEAASEHGVLHDKLYNFVFFILWIVFFLTQTLLFVFSYKYYYRKDRVATYYPHNNKLEYIWTAIPAIVLAIMMIYGLKTWNTIMKEPSADTPIIEIYAKQFDWTARFAGKDNILGDANYRRITGINALGIDSLSKAAQDDIIVKNEFHIPVNKEVEFKFRSRDVIHSAYFPHFRAQMNVVPGMVTRFHFKPIITTAEMRKRPEVIEQMKGINEIRKKKGEDPVEFDYILLCNKICGNSHYNMQMTIIVDTQEDYEKWLASKKTFLAKTETAPVIISTPEVAKN